MAFANQQDHRDHHYHIHLFKTAREGFALIDDVFVKTNYHNNNQKTSPMSSIHSPTHQYNLMAAPHSYRSTDFIEYDKGTECHKELKFSNGKLVPQVFNQAPVAKIGREGFAVVDEVYGKNNDGVISKNQTKKVNSITRTQQAPSPQNHRNYQYQYQQVALVQHGTQVATVIEKANNSNAEATFYFSTNNGVVREPVIITSDTAAQFYGGFIVNEYGRPTK